MKKVKLFAIFVIASMFFVPNVFAEVSEKEALKSAISSASGDTVIDVSGPIDLGSDSLTISGNKNITLNLLDGASITSSGNVIVVDNGSITLKGKGTISGTGAAATILVKGTSDATERKVVIGNGITVTSTSRDALLVTPTGGENHNVLIDVSGTLNGSNSAINVNGQLKNEIYYPTININASAKLSATNGSGMYLPGYAHTTVRGTVTGTEVGIGIKSGTLVIDGGTVTATAGTGVVPPAGNGNGMNGVGVALQIESHENYAGNMNITINPGSTLKSTNSAAVYEYLGQGDETGVTSLDIEGGDFQSSEGVPSVQVSEKLNEKEPDGFIHGGTYSSMPNANYLVAGLEYAEDENGNTIVRKEQVSITLHYTGDNMGGDLTTIVDKGSYITKEGLEALFAADFADIDQQGYQLIGYYTDKDYTTEFDFKNPLDTDIELYAKMVKKPVADDETIPVEDVDDTTTDEIVENPDTSDSNVYGLFLTFMTSGSGLIYLMRRR